MFKKLSETLYNDDFEIIRNVGFDAFIVKEIIPGINRELDEHIKVYEQLIKDLKSLQSNK